VDQQPGLAVGRDRAQLSDGEPAVQRNRHEAGPYRRDLELEELHLVVGEKRDPVAALESAREQARSQPRGPLVDVGEGQRPFP
jgi:hypothetical protein